MISEMICTLFTPSPKQLADIFSTVVSSKVFLLLYTKRSMINICAPVRGGVLCLICLVVWVFVLGKIHVFTSYCTHDL